MIVPEHIEIHNYVLFRDESIDLDGNTFFVEGHNTVEPNQKSNGAGKSLFMNAFVWCLFEDIRKSGVKRDEIIGKWDNWCSVKLKLKRGDDNIIVHRVRNHPDHGNDVFLYVNGEERHHPTDKRETTKRIEDILGMSKKVFYYCAFSDALTDSLVTLTSGELNKVVSQILDTSRYDDYLSKIRKISRDCEENINTSTKQINSEQNHINSLKQVIANYKSDLSNFEEQKHKDIEFVQGDIDACKSVINDIKDKLDGRQSVEEKLESFEDTKDNVEDVNRKLSSKKREIKNQKKTCDKLEKKYQNSKTKRKNASKNLENLTKNPEGKCNVCGNYLKDSDELVDKIKKFENKKDKYKNREVEHEGQLKVNRKKLHELKEEKQYLEQKLDGYQEDIKQIKNLERKIQSFSDLEKRKKKSEKRLDKLQNKLSSIEERSSDSIEENIKENQQKLKHLQDKVDKLKEDMSESKLRKEASEYLKRGITKLKAARFNSFMVRLESQINSCLDQITNGNYKCRLAEDGDELQLEFKNSSKNQFMSYHNFSTGEKKIIEKASSVALNDMMNIGLVIDDEGVGNVDGPVLNGILNFLVDHNQDKTMFFVSHDINMKDYFSDASKILITKDVDSEGVFSTIEVN